MDPSTERRRSILLVDDEPAIRRLLRLALDHAGYDVEDADGPATALAALGRRPFDMALVDKNLGIEDGIELVRAATRMQPHIVPVLMTAYGSVESSLDALDAGVAGYLLKPFDDVAAVVSTVRDVFDSRARRAEIEERFRGLASTVDGLREMQARLGDASARRARPAPDAAAPLRILVASAEPAVRAALREALRAPAFAVETTDRRDGVLQAFESAGDRYDAVLVDGASDEASALAVLESIRAADDATGVVLLGAEPSLATTRRLIQIGGSTHLRRPLTDAADVQRRVRGAVARARGPLPKSGA